ncbi:MAG: hypothetical protein JJLCMIEE_01225 [Acidimicrobiales bacterium]|nr:hypothetical protein [Acidimicrobiales bacterium]
MRILGAARMIVLVAAAALVLSACGDDGTGVREIGEGDSSGSGSGTGSGSSSGSASGSAVSECEPVGDLTDADLEIDVELKEWDVIAPAEVERSGKIGVRADNTGEEPHEVVIVSAGSAADLPVADGKVQEDQLPEGSFIGEIEAFPAGETCNGVFDLAPGDYVFFCNIIEEEDDGTIESHFELGMHTGVKVR